MPRWRLWFSAAIIALLLTAPVAAQTPPITFEDPLPTTATLPDPIEATVLNNTTETLTVAIQVTDLADSETGALVPADQVFQPLAPAVTMPPAGQAKLRLAVRPEFDRPAGTLTGSLVLSVPSHNFVLRKPFSLNIGTPPSAQADGKLTPAVESWTLNALRVLPFLRPICLRGLTAGCTIPLRTAETAVESPYEVGYLTNTSGGGLHVELVALSDRSNAQLALGFDRRWGYAGTYQGRLDLRGAATAGDESSSALDLTIHVKDIVIWPLLTLWLGIVIARRAQRYITVRRRTLALLERLNEAALAFGKLRKSVHGYTVAADFQARRNALESHIRDWDRTHYGELTAEELQQLNATIITPLVELEEALDVWKQFRQKLDRLGRRLLQDAQPAIREAEPPNDIELKEPRFYTTARLLLRGTKLQMSQVIDYAQRIDDAAELAGKWGELQRLAILARDAIRELNASDVELSESENEMLEVARHHTNSAARDLWEAPTLAELRQRETESELITAQELTRRLMDPFVYYRGIEAPTRHRDTGGDREGAEAFPIDLAGEVPSLARTYALIDTYRLPHLDFDTYHSLPSDQERAAYVGRVRLFSERTITIVALLTALLLGLERYVSTPFGTSADYLALFASGLAAKAGLEAANLLASRFLDAKSRT